jgi:hypothetical protein
MPFADVSDTQLQKLEPYIDIETALLQRFRNDQTNITVFSQFIATCHYEVVRWINRLTSRNQEALHVGVAIRPNPCVSQIHILQFLFEYYANKRYTTEIEVRSNNGCLVHIRFTQQYLNTKYRQLVGPFSDAVIQTSHNSSLNWSTNVVQRYTTKVVHDTYTLFYTPRFDQLLVNAANIFLIQRKVIVLRTGNTNKFRVRDRPWMFDRDSRRAKILYAICIYFYCLPRSIPDEIKRGVAEMLWADPTS